MAKLKQRPKSPIYKTKALKTPKFRVKFPKLPKIKSSRIKI